MAQYRLPDGKIIEVPDDTSPEGLQALQTQLAGLYPDYYQPYEPEPERSVLGGLAQTPKALPRGFLNTLTLGAIGLSEGKDFGDDNKLTSDLKNLKAYINADPSADVNRAITFQKEILTRASPMAGGLSVLTDYLKGKAGITESLLAPDEDYRGSLYQSVPEGLGSAAAFIGTTAVNPYLGGTLAAGTGIGTQAELQDQARAKGEEISLGQEIKSKVAGAAIGISEILNPLSILKIFKGLRKGDPRAKPYVKLLKDSAKSAGIEGTQEAVAGYLQELVAQGIYDPTLEVGESMADDFTVGAIVGGIVGAGSSAAHHQIQKNQASDYEQSQANELAKQDAEQDEIIKQRVILAEQQGDQIIDPDLVPDPFVGPVPDEIKPEGVEIPVLESFDFVANDDGSVNVIGKETQQSIGIFPNIEEAARAATEKTKQNRNQFVVGSAEQISNINGLAGNGTASNIARKLYDPLNTLIDAKVLANFDVRVSDKRQQQFKKEQEIQATYDEANRRLASRLMENIDTSDMSNEDLVDTQQKLASELANIQTAYPVDGNIVSPESTLGLFWQYADKSGVGAKNFYTVKEAKKLLNKADFNQLMSEKSNIKFKKIEATGELKPVKRDKGKLDISQKSFDEVFESKNIEVDYNSPAFKYLAETFTGNTNFSSMSVGQKEMLLSHIKSLPRFNNKTKLPNYTPRPYTAEQINSFYNQFQGNKFTNKDIKLAVKNDITGSDLTPKQIEQFKIDLIDSGRASKTKNRLTMTDDFTIQQARRAESYSNETTDEFKNRLRRTTLLTTEQIEEVVNNDATYKQGVIEANDLLALPSPEPMDKYSNLLDLMKQRLADRNLKDVGFAFDNALKASLNIKQKGDKYFYQPVDLDKSKGKPIALYDRPLNKIVASIEAIDPDGTMSETELAAELTNQLDHESIHALVQLGVLKQKEFDILLRDAKRLLPKDFQNKLKASYTGADNKVSEEELNEELVAEFFRISINNPSKLISPKSKTIIDKILNFLTTLGQTIYDAGFNSSRTIIRDIESGKIGARERDAPRNVQRLRTINERKYGIARPTSAQLDTSKLSKYSNIPFSRQERESLKQEIEKLDNQIAEKIRRYDLDYAYLPVTSARNDQNEIAYLEKKRDILKEKLRSLKPTQLDFPSFSRIQPVELDESSSTRISARVKDQEIELHYSGKDKYAGGEHRQDEDTGEGFYNWAIYAKPTSRNSPIRQSVRWLLQSFKNNGWQDGKRTKKWKKTDTLQDVANFLNKENGLTENDRGYISVDDDLVGYLTLKEDKDIERIETNGYGSAYKGLLSIEIEDKAKGKGIAKATVAMVASTNPSIVNGKKQLEIYDITPQGEGFWDAIGTEFNRDRIKKASIKLSYLDGKIGFAKDEPSFSRGPRNESSGHLADYVPAQYGPPAHQLDIVYNDEVTQDGYYPVSYGFRYPYSTQDIQSARREFLNYSTARTQEEQQEEREFINKLMEIKGNPNATITMYQAAPQRDLREGDLITPFLSEAQYYVDESKITQKEIRDADRARRRQEQIDKTGAVDLQQERLFNQMEGISDILGRPDDPTPSTIHTYELKAGDVRWDGNNGWARWGYFPRIKAVEDQPSFSRAATKDSPAYLDLTKANLEYTNEWAKNETENTSRLVLPFITRMPIDDFLMLTSDKTIFQLIKSEKPKNVDVMGDTVALNPNFDPDIFNKLPRRMNRYVGAYPYLSINEDGKVIGHEGRHRLVLGQKDGAIDAPVIIMFEPTGKALPQKEKIYSVNNLEDLGIKSLLPQFKKSLTDKVELLVDTNIINDQNINQALAIATLPDGIQERQRLNNEDKQSALFSIQQIQSIPANLKNDLRYSAQLESHYDNLIDLGYLESSPQDIPSFSRINSKELYDDFRRETNNPKTFEQTAEEFKEYKESLPSTMMPRWNEAASPIAIRAGFDYQEGIEPVVMTDAPSYSRSDKEIPDKYKNIDKAINGDNNTPDETFANTLIDVAETAEEVGGFLSRMRSQIIDDFNIQEKTVLKISKASAKVRELQSRAISGAIQSLRMSKKARGIVSQMLTRGVPVLVDEQGNPVPKNVQGFGGTKVVDFKYGGFVQIFGQLHTTEFGVDLMRLYKMYSIGVRGTRLNKEGKEVVLTPEQLKLAKEIEIDFPIIKKVYDEYQEYNNAILDYAVQTGILSEEITINQLIENITSSTKKISEKQLQKLRIEAKENGFTDEQFRQELLTLANDTNLNLPEGKKIDIRGTAEIWRNNSDYYPFYRKMADDTIQGPAVAGGFLSGNPFGIPIKGSKETIEPEPLEVMARNMQSIIGAAMKNEGLSRLMAVYEEGGLAQKILPKDQKEARNMGSDVISVFENGEKIYYQVADPIFTYGLQALGMSEDVNGFMKIIGLPSNILREAITRDPGFIIKNMLRDTLSASVTSGADFIPIVDTFKGFAADLSELERFGVIGGYDAANDRQDIVKRINKIKREQGLDVYDEEGNFAINQIVRLWDAAGGLTTRSDGATRKAVADTILALTGDQVEAAYQGLEIINFDRRGFNPVVRIVTTAIPFLNARFQGLDVLYRSGTGQYSSKISDIVQKTTPDEQAKSIILTTAFRGGLLMLATGLYYALMGDEERYKEERQSVRDDNWLIPMPFGLPPLKFPIPFEVGFIYKTIPERIVDYTMTELDDPNYGNTTGKQLEESITRGITTTLKLDPFAWQVIQPLREAYYNRSSFTGNPIVPPFMEQGLDPQLQSTINTSSFAIALGKATNRSPIKIDHILKGYTGTIGTYVLNMADTGVRQATGRDYVAPYLTQLPIAKSLFASPIGGGLQEQFYEMRTYSNMVTQTINKLEKEGRKDELIAFMQSHKGAISTRDEVLRIDRFMKKYRNDKLSIQIDKRLSAKQKQEIIERLDRDRNLRLAIVPFLVKQTDQSAYLSGLIRN